MKFITTMILATALSSSLAAQPLDDRYTYRIDDTNLVGSLGQEVELIASLDFPTGDPVEGWSFSICHDPQSADPIAFVVPSEVLEVNAGVPPAFLQVNIVSNAEAVSPNTPGVNQGVFIDFSNMIVLPASADFPLLQVEYEVLSDQPGLFPVEFCDTVLGGAIPVATLIAIGGQSFTTNLENGELEVLEPASAELSISSILMAQRGERFTSTVELTQNVTVQGGSVGVSHDGSQLDLLSIESGSALDPLNLELLVLDVNPSGEAGGTVLFLTDSMDPGLPAGADQELARFEYVVLPGNTSVGDSVDLVFTDALPAPTGSSNQPLFLISADGAFAPKTLTNGQVLIEDGPFFLRGDGNLDGLIDVADAVTILEFIFFGNPVGCQEALEINGNVSIAASDAVDLLVYLFAGGTAPPAPIPSSGSAPTTAPSISSEKLCKP